MVKGSRKERPGAAAELPMTVRVYPEQISQPPAEHNVGASIADARRVFGRTSAPMQGQRRLGVGESFVPEPRDL